MILPWLAFLFSFVTPSPATLQGPWAGEWVTDLGLMVLTQQGNEVRGSYAQDGEVEGAVEGKRLRVSYKRGQASGTGEFELAADARSFQGDWRSNGGSGAWRGWLRDPHAGKGKTADFGGVWLSSLGTLQLAQKGKRVKGTFGAQGWGEIEGEVEGRRLNLTWKRLQWSGPAALEQTPDGKRLVGMTEEEEPAVWLGVKLSGFDRHAKPKPGEVVEGRADNGMLYFLRVPKAWKKGKPTDVIVLLHGSNWTTKGMVHVTASQWPEIAERFAILGVQGEQWASWSEPDDLRFNYTYVNWMGKSTYEGYPHTDRESPYLVTQVIDELDTEYGFGRTFVGGHSQGAFLTYLLHMHFPEKWAGTFPMAGGLVIQAEPDVFEDAQLLTKQHATPMAIVHGTQDDVVAPSTGRYVHERLLAHGFPALHLFAPERGHAYDFLPVDEAIAWLDAMSTSDPAVLASFVKGRAAAGEWRDVAAAQLRAKALKADEALAPFTKELNEAAAKEASTHLAAIEANRDGAWVDGYLAWQDKFEFAPAAQSTVKAYQRLQKEHDPKAKDAQAEARRHFNEGRRDAGSAKHREIVERWYAARNYRTVKRWLAAGK